MQEAEAARAAADAAGAQDARQQAEAEYAMVRQAVADVEAGGNDLPPDLARRLAVSETMHLTSAAAVATATEEARYRMMALSEWRDFIREPLRRAREEMRSRGMLLPDLPPDISLGEDDA